MVDTVKLDNKNHPMKT